LQPESATGVLISALGTLEAHYALWCAACRLRDVVRRRFG